jgi:hypothetical protein
MASFNYRVGDSIPDLIDPGDQKYPVFRYGLAHDKQVALCDTYLEAERLKNALLHETSVMSSVARNEAVHDIRREFLGDKRLKIDLSALPHIAQAKAPGEVAITIALAEMTEALNELAALRRVIAECVNLSELLRMGYTVSEGNALIAECEAQKAKDDDH